MNAFRRTGKSLSICALSTSIGCLSKVEMKDALHALDHLHELSADRLPSDQKETVSQLLKCYDGYDDLVDQVRADPEKYVGVGGLGLLHQAQKRPIFPKCLHSVEVFVNDPRSPDLLRTIGSNPGILQALGGQSTPLSDSEIREAADSLRVAINDPNTLSTINNTIEVTKYERWLAANWYLPLGVVVLIAAAGMYKKYRKKSKKEVAGDSIDSS